MPVTLRLVYQSLADPLIWIMSSGIERAVSILHSSWVLHPRITNHFNLNILPFEKADCLCPTSLSFSSWRFLADQSHDAKQCLISYRRR